MLTFSLGLLIGSLVPAVAIYLAGGSRAACAVIGFLIPLAFALKFPRKIGRALLWIAGERSNDVGRSARSAHGPQPCSERRDKTRPIRPANAVVVKGYRIIATPTGFTVPALDADSVFDTARDAARFIRGVA